MDGGSRRTDTGTLEDDSIDGRSVLNSRDFNSNRTVMFDLMSFEVRKVRF